MKKVLKRSLASVLVMCMLVGLFPASVITAFAEEIETVFYGDADADGDVDLQDILAIEKYIKDNTAVIDKTKADVNADAAVDETDADLIREYLAGNLNTLKPVLVTITFNTDGGDPIPSIQVGKGYTYKGEIPNAVKENATFINWATADGKTFYQDSMPFEGDTTLNAVYENMPSKTELTITSFDSGEQEPNYSVKIVSKSNAYTTAEEVEAGITLLPKDGSDPVAVAVTANGDGTFNVYAPDGFLKGATYELTLPEGLSFDGKDDMFRTTYFSIKKDEKDNIKFNSDLIFIQDTPEMQYTINGTTTQELEVAFLSNDEKAETIKGTFNMPNSTLKAGDIVCIYETVHPNARDYTVNDYEGDAIAYVRITSVNGETHEFENLNDGDAKEVISMPDTIVYNVDKLPTANGTVLKASYDIYARKKLGKNDNPEFKLNDFIVFYKGDFEEMVENTNEADVVYAQITSVGDKIVSYKIITKADVDNYMGMFVSKEVDGQELLDSINQEQVLKNIKEQAESSGFIEEAANRMISSAFETEEVKEQLETQGLSDAEIQRIQKEAASQSVGAGAYGKPTFAIDSISVVPEFIKSERFENGIGVALNVSLILSIDTKMNSKMNSLKIELSAGFEEEIAFGFDVSVEDRWNWYAFIPVLDDLDVNISIDIQNYTYITLGAKIYTISSDILKKKWDNYQNEYFDVAPMEVKKAIRDLNKLGGQVKRFKNNLDKLNEVNEQIKQYKDMIAQWELTLGNKEYSLEKFEEEFNAIDASKSFDEMFNAEDRSEYKTGLDSLMKKYQDMLEQECDWVQLVDQKIWAHEFHLKVVAIKVSVNFVVKGNVNIAIGADVEYQIGKRYMFWLHILDGTSGSSEIDLNDERFCFQFYVMGALGIKAGIKADVSFGIISTSFASIGGNIEFGAYLKLWGYFFYIYERDREANTSNWVENEELMGALYLEFGLYVTVRFKAQVLENTFKYEPTLYDGEFPLLWAGERQNVYDFVMQPTQDDTLYIKDSDSDSRNGATMAMPDVYFLMKRIDLCNGEMSQSAYPKEKFNITFSNSDFSFNEANNQISVKNQGNGRFHATSDMRIVWKSDKLAFSKFDTDITIPLVWTNYSDAEIKERFTASVAVGNTTDGYETVWTKQYSRLDVFDLPTQEEILDLIGYYRFETESDNIKYSNKGGYTEDSTGLSLTGDKTYYYDIDKKKYELTVKGIHKPDGTTEESRTFTATYGEEFDLSSLKNTGKDNSVTNEYTSFKNLTDASGNVIDDDIVADQSFVTKFGDTNGSVTANYNNDALTAKYVFVGIGNVPPVEIKFKRGTTPIYQGLNDYIKDYGVDNVSIRITPVVAPSNNEVTYTVNCSIPATEVKKYQVTYYNDPEGPDVICTPQEFEAGEQAGRFNLKPTTIDGTEPVGYTFKGWHTDNNCDGNCDSNCPKLFDFTSTMPAHDITLYAKWTAVTYNVSFETGIGTAPSAIKLTYGSEYGPLPTLTDPDYRFEGWYTGEDGTGTKITATSTFKLESDQTLHAYWIEKITVDTNWFTDIKNEKDFNDSKQTYTYTLPAEHQALKTGMVIYYKKQGTDTYTTEAPINAGTYDIKLTRPACNTYKALAEFYINDGLVINKIRMESNPYSQLLHQPPVFTNGYGVISASLPSDFKGDGAVTYVLHKFVDSTFIEVARNNTGFFNNINGGDIRYCIQIEVAEGTNYYAAKSNFSEKIVVGSPKLPPYMVTYTLNITDGTHSTIDGGVYYANGAILSNRFNSGGGVADYIKGEKFAWWNATISPWMITGVYLTTSDKYALDSDPELRFAVKLRLGAGSGTGWNSIEKSDILTGYGAINTWEKTGYLFPHEFDSKGNIYSCPDLDLSESGEYTFTYNGIVTDNFNSNGYNIFEYEGAPSFSVTANQPEYQNFVKLTGISSITIDRDGLKEYLKKYGGVAPAFTLRVEFPSADMVDGSKVWTPTIYSINVPSKVSKTASSSSATSAVSNTGETVVNTAVKYASKPVAPVASNTATEALTENNAITISANDIKANPGDTISVPVKVNTNKGIWGTLASINYDSKALELQGYTLGNAFSEDSFVATKNLTGDSFKLLMTNQALEDTTATGEAFVTLNFKVNEKASKPQYTITLDVVQTINVNGDVLQSEDDEVEVDLDSEPPVIAGVQDGGIYYGDTTITVTDNYLDKFLVDGNEVTLTDNKYTITPDNNEHTIVAVDKSGHTVEYKITVCKIYTLTFKVDDKVYDTLNVNHNTAVGKLPTIPHKEGYDQVDPYWTIDGEKITEETIITNEATVLPVYTINRYSVSIPANQRGYELTVDNSEVNWNKNAKLTFKVADGYSKTDDFAVKVNGKAVEFTDGEYTIANIKEDIKVTVQGVVDLSAPTVLRGDATCDNVIGIVDCVAMQKHIIEGMELSLMGKFAADVNDDGVISISDVVIVMKYIIGLDSPYRVGTTVNTSIDKNTLYLYDAAIRVGNERYAVYVWNSSTDNMWLDMTAVSTNLYEANIPENYKNVIFCRMNGKTTENNWDNVWNQTSDLTFNRDNQQNLFTATNWGENVLFNGNWSSYDPFGNRIVYLNDSAIHKDNDRYAIYVWKTSSEDGKWINMTSTDTHLYQASVPDGYTNIIFCRMNGDTTENGWNNVWNQSADLRFNKNSNEILYTATGWGSNKLFNGTWSGFEPFNNTTVYLNNTAIHKDNDRYAIYVWESSETDGKWIDMTLADTNIYKANVPAGYTNIIFCRMNRDTTENNWDTIWNQSSNLIFNKYSSQNLYTATGWGAGDLFNGKWSA